LAICAFRLGQTCHVSILPIRAKAERAAVFARRAHFSDDHRRPRLHRQASLYLKTSVFKSRKSGVSVGPALTETLSAVAGWFTGISYLQFYKSSARSACTTTAGDGDLIIDSTLISAVKNFKT
jgi:hypothetical protein